jgi:hypothetical protein
LPPADPEAAAKKLVETANSVEAVQDGRIFIELINWSFIHDLKGTPADMVPALHWRSSAAGFGCMSPVLT